MHQPIQFPVLLGTQLGVLDWVIVAGSLLGVLLVGVLSAKRAGTDTSQFFLSGRDMPWWLLGLSMVATTFAADTPNLVTDIVRKNGVAGNWVWWAFLLTGMLTVSLYARLWRRSGLMTDLAFYEIRYDGKQAAFLRGFRALYLGVLFNVLVMAVVMLAAIKFGQVLLGLSPWQTILVASLVTAIFSTLGGFRAIVITDGLLFVLSITGALVAAWFALSHPDVGSMEALCAHDALQGKLNMFPVLDMSDQQSVNTFITILVIPLAVQWWSVWYPGAEPGGGGYLAQRMLAAKSPGHAVGAALFFNFAHYALRPWPWVIVALASLVVFPDLQSLASAFPDVAADKMGDDLAYPAMLSFVPTGWLGLVVASLVAAYMSTISTHLNWGSSYVVADFYQRFIRRGAGEKELVRVGQISTLLMLVLATVLAVNLQDAMQGFQILLQIGAGTGLLFILRWFWWRINAQSEVVAMVVSFLVALLFAFFAKPLGISDWAQLLIGVGVTTACWLAAAFVFPSTNMETLENFCRLVRPGGPGWKPVRKFAADRKKPLPKVDSTDSLALGFVRMILGTVGIYSALFASGWWLFCQSTPALTATIIAAVCSITLFLSYRKC